MTLRTPLLVACALALTALAPVQGIAQERYVPWRFGINAGLNYNMAGVGYALWQTDRSPLGHFLPFVMNDGSGIGPYLGIMAEYRSTSWWGVTLRASYDSRVLLAHDDQSFQKPDGSFYDDQFDFKNTYLSIEPRLRINPADDLGLFLSVGPSISVAMNTKYDYIQDGGFTLVDQEVPDATSMTYAFAAGLGWDIRMNDAASDWHVMMSPFLEMSWLLAQRGVDFADLQGSFDDALSTTSIRAGVSIKLGKVKDTKVVKQDDAFFTVYPPEDGIVERTVVEEFYPLIPYVFFDRNDTTIPERYVRLDAAGVADFRNQQWDAEDLKNIAAREFRQGEVYYNILNLFAMRMESNPTSTLTLIGSDPVEKNGETLAAKVRDYLVNVWGISPTRINVKGQINPNIVSGSARTPVEDRPAAELENRRVEFQFSDVRLLREAHLKAERKATLENDIRIELNTNENIDSWTVRIRGNNVDRNYGPYYGMEELISPDGLLSGVDEATFTADVVARTTDGRTLTESRAFSLRKSAAERRTSRFSIVFNYGEDDPVRRYETFLKNDAAERIPAGATVFVHGHTDNLGKDDVNLRLSRQRAEQAKKALVAGLKAKGKGSVRVIAVGRGEDPASAPFNNAQPEGRHYNRTVVLDVVPKQ